MVDGTTPSKSALDEVGFQSHAASKYGLAMMHSLTSLIDDERCLSLPIPVR
jgi:hypothetical protein